MRIVDFGLRIWDLGCGKCEKGEKGIYSWQAFQSLRTSEPQSFRTTEPQRSEVGGQLFNCGLRIANLGFGMC